MSKKLIAGAGVVASFAIALAPLATFALDRTAESDRHVDTLKVTVAPACAFGRVINSVVTAGVAHDVGSANTTADVNIPAGTWTTDTASNGLGRVPDKDAGSLPAANISGDSFAYSIYAGTSRDDVATTSLTIFCNTDDGYTLKALTADLQEWNTTSSAAVSGGETIPALTTYSASVSGYAIASVSSEDDDIETVSGKFANKTASFGAEIAHKEEATDDGGDTITMTYGIGVQPDQKAALYQGTVTYTLFQGFESQQP